ncbi:MAG: hypothetical protein AB8B53_02165 [Flavobacteriales bacterium]
MRSSFPLFCPLLVVFLFSAFITFGQEEETGSLSSGTIESQYDYMWESSNRYQDHRVIKNSKLAKFKSNVLDSLTTLEQSINGLEKTITSQSAEAKKKQSEIDSLQISLTNAEGEKENFSILGTDMSKSSFKSLFWIITSVLAFLTIFSFVRMKSKMSTAKDAKYNFTQLEGEFEDYKKKSREKEQVLARQLQDEINKNL